MSRCQPRGERGCGASEVVQPHRSGRATSSFGRPVGHRDYRPYRLRCKGNTPSYYHNIAANTPHNPFNCSSAGRLEAFSEFNPTKAGDMYKTDDSLYELVPQLEVISGFRIRREMKRRSRSFTTHVEHANYQEQKSATFPRSEWD